MTFLNPFNKPLAELNSADLAVLRQVSEGWYVEYKQEWPGVESAAKSISAFANTYGGWIFYGIVEAKDRTAGIFSGVPKRQVEQIHEWLQQAVTSCMQPDAFFEVQVINGPDADLGLEDDRAVVVVRVPKGNNAPYVHKTGRFFRRVADSSAPLPEVDRHSLDLMWTRAEKSRERFSRFVERKPQTFDGEKATSFLKLYLFPDPWGDRSIYSKMDFKTFSKIMGSADPVDGGIPFSNIYSAANSFVARQTENNDPGRSLFTWQYFHDGVSEIVLPFNSVDLSGGVNVRTFLHGYEHAIGFQNICRSQGMKSGHLIDVSQMFTIILSVIKRASIILESDGIAFPIYAKAQLSNMLGRVPFLDTPEVMSFYQGHGLPLIQEDVFYAPIGLEPDSCLELRKYKDFDPKDALTVNALTVFSSVLQALGFPLFYIWGLNDEDQDQEGGSMETLARLYQASERAKSVSANRTGGV